MLTQCPELPPLQGKTGAALTRKLVEISRLYHECAAGKAALIDAELLRHHATRPD